MVSTRDIETAVDIVAKRWSLEAMWLFGSAAVGREGPESDVDLAVLVGSAPSALDRLAVREELTDALKRPVDLVVLDDASPVLAMQVLGKGRLVANRKPRRQAEFVVRTITAYADLKRARACVEQAIKERLANG